MGGVLCSSAARAKACRGELSEPKRAWPFRSSSRCVSLSTFCLRSSDLGAGLRMSDKFRMVIGRMRGSWAKGHLGQKRSRFIIFPKSRTSIGRV